MAIVTDPDLLIRGTDFVIDTTNKTIELLTGSAIANAGATGGVRLQTLYSKLKETFKGDDTLFKFRFPMLSITDEQFEFNDGWKLKNDTSRKLVRSGGWAERNSAGTMLRAYKNVTTLGALTGQPYYRWNSGSKTDFSFTGPVNEPVQIFGDATNGNVDYTSAVLTVFSREQGKKYASASSTSIGQTTLTYKLYTYPLGNEADLKVTADDATVAANAPYTSITVQYYGTDQGRTIDGAPSQYRVIVTDASGSATTAQIYTKLQYALRQNSDIDAGAGTVTGATADALASFLGDTLVTSAGVAIDNLNANFLNSVTFTDKNGASHIYPYNAAGTITFGANSTSGDFKWKMYHADTYNTAGATVVKDKDGVNIEGTFSGSSVNFTFAYDTYSLGGHTPGTDLPVMLKGIGTATAQPIEVSYTIQRAVGQSFPLLPNLERNYKND